MRLCERVNRDVRCTILRRQICDAPRTRCRDQVLFERFRSFMEKIMSVTLLIHPTSVYTGAVKCLILAVDRNRNKPCWLWFRGKSFPIPRSDLQPCPWPGRAAFTSWTRVRKYRELWGSLDSLRIKCTAMTCTMKCVSDTLMPLSGMYGQTWCHPNSTAARSGHSDLCALAASWLRGAMRGA